MELDRIAATLRPRRPWEGLDLGFALGRTWFPTLWPLWWISVLPMALLWLPLTGARTDLWMLGLWWFKPLYEAPLVYWTSHALFGERLPMRSLPSILRASWTRRLLPFLLWRRLGFSRSFNLPIALLEGLHGPAARQRRRVLSGGSATAAWLTLVCYHFEAILWGGLLLTLFFLIPEGLPRIDLQAALTDSQSWPYWTSSLFYLVASSIVAPFYVCGGFALYLTRRTELEAWDLELAFRQIETTGQPRELGRPGSRALGIGGALALALLIPAPGTGPCAAELPDAQGARGLIAEVLSDPDFGHTREVGVWVPIGEDKAESGEATEPPGWLGDLAIGIGRLFKWLLIALAVAALVLLARRVVRDWQPPRRRRRTPRARAPASRPMPPDEDPYPDPADLAALVRARLAAGDPRGALALLYRGGLAHLARRGAEIPQGATEGDALRLAVRHLTDLELKPFRRITRDWQGLAYAHRTPDPETISERLDEWLSGTADAASSGSAPAADSGATHGG